METPKIYEKVSLLLDASIQIKKELDAAFEELKETFSLIEDDKLKKLEINNWIDTYLN
jgi:hypothetical protein